MLRQGNNNLKRHVNFRKDTPMPKEELIPLTGRIAKKV